MSQSDEIKVSVSCTTYNHAAFIEQAIEGFLAQKTNFKFEVIIHDDASTDGTTEIVQYYAQKYPNIISPIIQKENQYSKGIKVSPTFVWSRVKGKYIALCEGDDYWTDPHKLQKQVDFLEANPEFSLCFHNVYSYHQKEETKSSFNKTVLEEKLDTNYVINNRWFIPTCSIVFRNHTSNLPDWFQKVKHGDYSLLLYLSQFGNFHYIDEIMGVYRLHESGISNQLHNQKDANIAEILEYFNKYSDYKFKRVIHRRMADLYISQALTEKHFDKKYFHFLVKGIAYYPIMLFFRQKDILRILLPKNLKKILKF